MMTYWTNFIKNGDPNVGAKVKSNWNAFGGDNNVQQLDTNNIGPYQGTQSLSQASHCEDVWEKIAWRYMNRNFCPPPL